jgi:hypothetical protein
MDKTLFDAVGQILKDERIATDAQIARLEEKLGDQGLIPKMAITRLENQKDSILRYCDDVMLKRSKLVVSKGVTPYHLRKLDH